MFHHTLGWEWRKASLVFLTPWSPDCLDSTSVAPAWNYTLEAIRTHPFDAFTLLFTSAALILSGLAWRSARRQANAAERQAKAGEEAVRLQTAALKRQAEDTHRAIEVATRSATAAEASAKSTQFLTEVAQRPWINHTDVKSQVQAVEGGGLSIKANSQLINNGRTPAFGLRLTQWLQVCDGIPKELFVGAFEGNLSSGILGPGTSGEIRNEIELSEAEAEAIKNGSRSLYLFGMAAYEDLLKGSHQTKWCLIFQAGTSTFSYSSDHNAMT